MKLVLRSTLVQMIAVALFLAFTVSLQVAASPPTDDASATAYASAVALSASVNADTAIPATMPPERDRFGAMTVKQTLWGGYASDSRGVSVINSATEARRKPEIILRS